MDEQQSDVVESLNPQEEVTEQEVITPAEESETSQPDIEELTKRAALADDYKKRAEIAERENKKLKSVHSDTPTHSLADLRAISSVHEDDVERLERFAKAENIPLKDAVRNPEWKAIEALRAEQRQTASAANVTNVRRGPTQVSEDTLLSNAASGKLPDSDAEIERLIAAKARASRG